MPTGTAILLTPPGTAALAVVRVSGALSLQLIATHFSKPVPPGRCVHGELKDEAGETIDDPVVVRVSDEAYDLSLHGGPWVVRATLDLCRRFGFDVIERSEAPLSVDAVDGVDDVERDVLRYLPLARTELATRALLAQREAWRERLKFPPFSGRACSPWLGLNEGRIEAESDRRAGSPAKREDVHERELMSDDRSLYWLLHVPRVAIVGPANVGKSTLANQLFATERSIVADVPGTTRDWVGEVANLDGLAVMLIDTPGLRDTTDEIEAEAIERAVQPIEQADLVVLVLDVTSPLEGEQADLVHRFPAAMVVLNKSDQVGKFDLPGLPTVATTGVGVDDLRLAIRAHFGIVEPYDLNTPRQFWSVTMTNQQQSTADERG